MHEEDHGLMWKHVEYRDGRSDSRRSRCASAAAKQTGSEPHANLAPSCGACIESHEGGFLNHAWHQGKAGCLAEVAWAAAKSPGQELWSGVHAQGMVLAERVRVCCSLCALYAHCCTQARACRRNLQYDRPAFSASTEACQQGPLAQSLAQGP